MKNKTILYIFLVLVTGLSANAQVKIGDNTASMNPNSLLELESTNKGLLAPRVTLISIDSAAPLSSPVPAGMLVYNNSGAVAAGFYFWNGSKWMTVATSNNVRTNFVLVRSASDFPAPVNGVITLVSGTTYEINGTVTVTSKIDLNGCTITGLDRVTDKILYTPSSGELFTGSNGGEIYNVTLSATGTGARLFNLDAGGAIKNLILEYSMITDCSDVGIIKGFGGVLVFQTIIFVNNSNGVTLRDIGDFMGVNEIWAANNRGTYQTLAGTFGTIQITGGKIAVLSALSATAFNITGITSLGDGELRGIMFTGNGTFVTGSFSSAWEVESHELISEKDETASGNMYISSTASTMFSAANTPVKVSGTTSSASLFRVSMPVNNRLTYAGGKTRSFQVIGSMSVTSAANNKYYSVYIAKNGVVLPESRQTLKLSTGSDQRIIALSCIVSLAENDYIELWAENNTDNTAMTIESLNLAIK